MARGSTVVVRVDQAGRVARRTTRLLAQTGAMKVQRVATLRR
jgi:hypothetical protein